MREYAGDRGRMPRILSVFSSIGPEVKTLRGNDWIVKGRGLPMYFAQIQET
jgi:hypothetical protein